MRHPGNAAGLDSFAGTVSLPIYYQWSFETGPQGDFASLVRKIHPKPLAPSVGFREMDVASPGLGLPPAADTALPVEGALKRYPEIVSPPQTGPTHDTWLQDLTKLLNEPAELFKTDPTKPLVTPPLYGHWHAAQPEVLPSSPPWFQDLNEDPRTRVQAGAATLAVQKEQQDLLAGAWDQVGAVRAANERARWVELAVEVFSRMHEKILVSTAPTKPDTLMRFTEPVLTRVMGSPVTIATLLKDSPVTDGALAPSFRRITRPRGPVARRQTRGTTPTAPSLIDRMNRGEFNPAPPPPTPSGVSTIGRYKGDLVPSWLTPAVLKFLKLLPNLLILLAIVLLIAAVILFIAVGPAAGAIALVIGVDRSAPASPYDVGCKVWRHARHSPTARSPATRFARARFRPVLFRHFMQPASRNSDTDGHRRDAHRRRAELCLGSR